MSIINFGGATKEEKAMEKSNTDLAIQRTNPTGGKAKQEKVPEHLAEDNNTIAQEEKQGIEQEKEQGQNKQTPEINLRPNTGGKHLDFSFSNFPILSAIPIRNGFESLMHSKLSSLPIDRGGASKTF